MFKHSFFYCFILFLAPLSYAQNKAAPLGQWRLHLPYQDCRVLAETPSKMYAASVAGLMSVARDGGETERLSRINGFSDVTVSAMCYSEENDVLLIAYDNTKIDIVKGNTVEVIDDIFRKTMLGLKRINHISFRGNLAYLATSFGIVVLDLNKLEIKDSYLNIGAGGSTVPVNALTVLGDSLYAATPSGILVGKLSQTVNLSDYNNWFPFKTGAPCYHIAGFNNKLFANIDSVVQVYSAGTWQPFDGLGKKPITNIDVYHNKVLLGRHTSCMSEDINGTRTDYNLNQFNYAILDKDGYAWYGSGQSGMIQKVNGNEIVYLPNGPKSTSTFKMLGSGNDLWVSAGSRSTIFGPTGNYNRYYRFNGTEWINAAENNPVTDSVGDWTEIAQHPISKNLYFGSMNGGLVEFVSGEPYRVFNEKNSPLALYGGLFNIASGVAFDKSNRMWVSNFGVDSPLLVRLTNGKWISYKFSQTSNTSSILIDGKSYKWILTPREATGGILVFDDGNSPENPANDRSILLNTSPSLGNLPSLGITCLALTGKGEIWIGSDLGLSVIRNPANVFINPSMLADRIIVSVEEGTNLGGYLLGSEVINCITIDGADRRWVGTNNGAWLIDNDGTTIIHHFTTENSPILSDVVRSIGVVEQSGDVFFGTDKGIISYRGNATRAEKTLANIKIFPNPVKENFDGDVSISGLSDNTTVKITDINGNLVYETTSNGGTATWNCRKFNGERPATGVYLAFCINEDGSETNMGKILFIH